MNGEPEVRVLADPTAVSEAAAGEIAASLREAVAERGTAHWATTGGSAPAGIYKVLAVPPLRDEVPWPNVHLWWGDDRYVPRDHPQSNALPAYQILLAMGARTTESAIGEGTNDLFTGRVAGAPIPSQQIHPFPTTEAVGASRGPAWAAARYEDELRFANIPTRDGMPLFDLVLLGVGPDGHLLSVFPGSPALDSTDWVLPIPAPAHVEPRITRVTLNPRIVEVARRVIVVVSGEQKAQIVDTVLGGERDSKQWPAQLARREGALWLLDTAAAGPANQPA